MQPTAVPLCSCSMMAEAIDASGLPRTPLPRTPLPPGDAGSSSPCRTLSFAQPHPQLSTLSSSPAPLACWLAINEDNMPCMAAWSRRKGSMLERNRMVGCARHVGAHAPM